jgi:hypothetical protein
MLLHITSSLPFPRYEMDAVIQKIKKTTPIVPANTQKKNEQMEVRWKKEKKGEGEGKPHPSIGIPFLLDELLLAGAGLYALGDRAVDVVVRDPALVIGLAGGLGAREGIGGVDGLLDGLLGSTRFLGLGEESLDPGLVDEVEGASESGSENKVQEDATNKNFR